MQNLSENEESEDDLLDRAPGLTPTSRLGCQAVFEKDDEVTIIVPRYTINQQVG
jgi:2Fe-2S ferredoxin